MLLTQTALNEISDLASWRRGTPLTWQNLAARVGVSRQALEKRDEVVDAFAKAKPELKKVVTSARAIVRRDAEQRINDLKRQVVHLNAQLDAYIEKWLQIEANCHRHGIDPKLVFGPAGLSASVGKESS